MKRNTFLLTLITVAAIIYAAVCVFLLLIEAMGDHRNKTMTIILAICATVGTIAATWLVTRRNRRR